MGFSFSALSASYAVLMGGASVVVGGCLMSGIIFLLSGLASFLDVRVLVGLFLYIAATLRGRWGRL